MRSLLLCSSFVEDDEFEWDDAKAASNLLRHSVSFDAAREVFRDPFAVEWLDEREDYGEERFAIIGMAQARVLYVAFTLRGDRTRIISARRVTGLEQNIYDENAD